MACLSLNYYCYTNIITYLSGIPSNSTWELMTAARGMPGGYQGIYWCLWDPVRIQSTMAFENQYNVHRLWRNLARTGGWPLWAGHGYIGTFWWKELQQKTDVHDVHLSFSNHPCRCPYQLAMCPVWRHMAYCISHFFYIFLNTASEMLGSSATQLLLANVYCRYIQFPMSKFTSDAECSFFRVKRKSCPVQLRGRNLQGSFFSLPRFELVGVKSIQHHHLLMIIIYHVIYN